MSYMKKEDNSFIIWNDEDADLWFQLLAFESSVARGDISCHSWPVFFGVCVLVGKKEFDVSLYIILLGSKISLDKCMRVGDGHQQALRKMSPSTCSENKIKWLMSRQIMVGDARESLSK